MNCEGWRSPDEPCAALSLQDNVALIAVLEALDPLVPADDGQPAGGASRRQLICIANTHIHANPELNDVKLWQVHLPPPPCPAAPL